MRELIDYTELGKLIEDEEIVVTDGDIHLNHDTIIEDTVEIYDDLSHTNQTTDFSYSLLDSNLPDGGEFTAIAFANSFTTLHDGETWYITYKTKGDMIQADDINSRSYRYLTYEAGETLLARKAVCIKNGKLYYADHTDTTTVNVIGITKDSASSIGDEINVYVFGDIEDDAFNFDTTKDIFVGENGELTQTPPAIGYSGLIARPITSSRIRIVDFSYIVL